MSEQPTTNTDIFVFHIHSAQTFQIYFFILRSMSVDWINKKLVFTSIQSWVHVAEIKEEGEAAIPPMLSPNEIWAIIGVPIAIPETIMVGL